jgi:hypothetical protein
MDVPDVGPFEAFYASALQHPILLWIAAGLALVWCAARRDLDPGVKGYCAILTALSLADAWLTSTEVYGVGALSAGVARVVSVFFVLAGDYRYLLLLFAATREGGIQATPRGLATAAALTAIVPLASQVIAAQLPLAQGDPRALFLVYEVAFCVLVSGLAVWHARTRRAPWLWPVTGCVLLYYALWAAADAMILAAGSDLGFALRVVPNLLYYGGLIAVIGWAGERGARRAV